VVDVVNLALTVVQVDQVLHGHQDIVFGEVDR
jgi:hypothetical protein